MLPGSRPRSLLAVVLGLLLSVATALPASATAGPVTNAHQVASFPDLPMLHAVMAVLDSRSQRVPNSVTSWYVDPATNSVVVSATDDDAARAFTAGQPGVRIQHVTTRPATLADLHGGDTITTSEGGRCSIGFNAVSGHTRYLITAGHCTKLGGTWSGPDGEPIGPAAKSAFPGHDYGLVEVASSGWDQTNEIDTNSGYVGVAGIAPAQLGDRVCLSGSTSGYHCGTVEAVNETVNYGEGNVVNGLTRTSVCAEAGDSGGPFMSGDQAQGTLSGGSGGCLLGGKSYFQPIREVLTTYGLTLLTGRNTRDER